MDKRTRTEGDDIADRFACLPDEVILLVLVSVGDAKGIARFGMTCSRMRVLAEDDSLWRPLYLAAHDAPVHERFREFGKNWAWLYRSRTVLITGRHRGGAAIGTTRDRCGCDTYSGELVDGLRRGYGRAWWITMLDTIVYEGQWANGVPHGEDECRWAIGYDEEARGLRLPRSFPCRFDCSERMHGPTEHPRVPDREPCDAHSGSCAVYAGEWAGGRPHGRGALEWDGADRYEGEFRRGTPHGQGVCAWKEGILYTGEFKNGRPHGRGVITATETGARYEGRFKCGRKSGFGTCVWPDGARYSGGWRGDEPHGRGTMLYAGGATHVGEWRRGLRHGPGLCIHADGSTYEGTWIEGRINPYFSLVSRAGGRLYERRWCYTVADGRYRHEWHRLVPPLHNAGNRGCAARQENRDAPLPSRLALVPRAPPRAPNPIKVGGRIVQRYARVLRGPHGNIVVCVLGGVPLLSGAAHSPCAFGRGWTIQDILTCVRPDLLDIFLFPTPLLYFRDL
jgi:hypothetical protein